MGFNINNLAHIFSYIIYLWVIKNNRLLNNMGFKAVIYEFPAFISPFIVRIKALYKLIFGVILFNINVKYF